MALTKIGATLGGSADVIQVTQSSHGLSLGFPVKVSGNGTYAHASADSAANAEAIGIIIATTTDTMTITLGGRITIDGVLPSGNLAAGTVLFLPTSAGKLTATEPSGNNEVSKPMAVITYLNSEMIMIQQRGEVISTAGITLGDESVDSDQYVDGSIDRVHLAADIIDGTKIADDVINSEHYVSGSIDLEHMASQSVDEDNLYISNAGSNGQFLSKQSGNNGGLTWAAAGGIASVVADTSPQLGGNLDFNGSDASGIGHLGFLATQSASAGANDLDDYEEGTGTPQLGDDTLDGTGESQSYTTQVLDYTKVGDRYDYNLILHMNSIGSLTAGNDGRILGLPIQGHSAMVSYGGNVSYYSSAAITANTSPAFNSPGPVTYLTGSIIGDTVYARDLTIAMWSAGGLMRVEGTMQTG